MFEGDWTMLSDFINYSTRNNELDINDKDLCIEPRNPRNIHF
jgi:hypothetical protein